MYLNMNQQQQIYENVIDFLNNYLEKNKGLTLEWWSLKNVLFLNSEKTTFIINIKFKNIETNEIKEFQKDFFVKFN